ncbi:MAG: hypothetical protein IJO33_04990 [Bacilli bacterium]|nr:hypothetical protein [Bacilli bacterium]
MLTNNSVGSNIVAALTNPNIKKYESEVEEILKKYDFNFKSFYATLFNRLAIYKQFPLYLYSSGLFIKEARREGATMILDTKDGIFKAMEATETIDCKILNDRLANNMLKNECHSISQELTETLWFDLCTSFCRGLFNNRYIHSYNKDIEGFIIDGSNNLVFDENSFNELYDPTLISQMTEEFVNDDLYHSIPGETSAALVIARKKGESMRF